MEPTLNMTKIGLWIAAAAAAVLALMSVMHRRGSVKTRSERQHVSSDFSALLRIRDGGGAAAAIARRVIEMERDPVGCNLGGSLRSLEPSDLRVLLTALTSLDIGIEPVTPVPGTRFDATSMADDQNFGDADCLVVADATNDKCGYRRGAQCLMQAEVDTCTVDWWCLVFDAPSDPVALAINANPERYTRMDGKYAWRWSATQGFPAVVNLRKEFGEQDIAEWSARFRERLAKWYPANDSRIPRVIEAKEGERYDASVMRAVDGAHEAHARVTAVESRDGIPQFGLGCAGSPPLLYAVVRVVED